MHKMTLVDLEPFRQQVRKGLGNLEINTSPEVMTNISHKCLLPHVIERHAGESFLRTGDMLWKFWHPTLLLDHKVEHLHELLAKLFWIAPGPRQGVTLHGNGKPENSSFGMAGHESSMNRFRYHEFVKHKSLTIIVVGFRFPLP